MSAADKKQQQCYTLKEPLQHTLNEAPKKKTTMATEAFLAKQVNDVLATIEKLSVMLEDGITTVMTGGIPSKTGARSSTGSEFDETGMTDDDLMDEGQAGMEHPLQGIADSVLGGIMKGQVSCYLLLGYSQVVRMGPQRTRALSHVVLSHTWGRSLLVCSFFVVVL